MRKNVIFTLKFLPVTLFCSLVLSLQKYIILHICGYCFPNLNFQKEMKQIRAIYLFTFYSSFFLFEESSSSPLSLLLVAVG